MKHLSSYTKYIVFSLPISAVLLIGSYLLPWLGYHIKPWVPDTIQQDLLYLVAPCAVFLSLYAFRKTWSFIGLCIAEFCALICFSAPFPLLAYVIYKGYHHTTNINGLLIPLLNMLRAHLDNLNIVLFLTIAFPVLWHIVLFLRCKEPCFATSRFTAGLIGFMRRFFIGLLTILLLLFVFLSLQTWLDLGSEVPSHSGVGNSLLLFFALSVFLFLRKRLTPTHHLLLPMLFLLFTLFQMASPLLYFDTSPVKPKPLQYGLGFAAATPAFWTAFALSIILVIVYFLYFFFSALRFPQPRIPLSIPEAPQQVDSDL